MVWNNASLVSPPCEGKYIVYKYYPYLDKYEVAIEIFKYKFKIQDTENNKNVLSKKFKFLETSKHPSVIKAWMFIPEKPVLSV